MRPILLQPPYLKREPPQGYSPAYFATELGNIQRGIPSRSIRTVTADYTPTSLDYTIMADATAGSLSILLPKADQAKGLYLTIKKVDGSANTVTLVGTVDSAISPTLTSQYDAMTVQSDGVQYYLLGSVP